MYAFTIDEDSINRFRMKLLEEERSAATIQKYIRDVRSFAQFAGTKAVSKELVIRYKEMLVKKYAAASVNSILAAVNRFLKELGRHDCVVKSLKIQRQAFRPREREITREEYCRLVEEARRRNDTRLCLLMQTICATGIRVSELKFITVDAVRQGVAVVSLKGKIRQVLLPAALRRKLKRYVAAKGIRQGGIFVTKNGSPMDRSNILHAMKGLCEAAHVSKQKVFPHNLRHLFACLYYQTSKDLGHLADVLGHSSVNTTRIYTTISGAEQRKQIERLRLVI